MIIQFLSFAGEEADVRSPHHGGFVDPPDRGFNLPLHFVAGTLGEVVADRGAGNGHATKERLAFEFQEIRVVGIRREKVTRQFSRFQALRDAVIEEPDHVDRFASAGRFFSFPFHERKVVA